MRKPCQRSIRLVVELGVDLLALLRGARLTIDGKAVIEIELPTGRWHPLEPV